MSHFTGYIEGYYGKLLTWTDRFQLLDALARLSLNTYLYAPKEDIYHRIEWRKPYPKAWKTEFQRFVTHARRKKIQVVPSIGPGLSFNYSSANDYRALLKKLATFVDSGATTLALLMDDIPPELPSSCQADFSSLGEAHGILLQNLLADLRANQSRGVSLWFCPTVYTDQFIGETGDSQTYLHDLSSVMPKEITVLWTGPRVVSPVLNKKTLSEISKQFAGNLVIWDNYYANDYCPRRLFFGPFRGRNKSLFSLTRGLLLNPTGLPNTDIFLCHLLSGLVHGFSPSKAWSKTIGKIGYAKALQAISPFFDSPFAQIPPLTRLHTDKLENALNTLIWQWKSSLQTEWYPYLFDFDTDLKFLKKQKTGPDSEWIHKKYPPVLARILEGLGAE